MIERMIERSCDRVGGPHGRLQHEAMVRESFRDIEAAICTLNKKRERLQHLRAHRSLSKREQVEARCIEIELDNMPHLREQRGILMGILHRAQRARRELRGE